METIKKNDFIELVFTGKTKDGNIFDTNVPSEAKKIDLKIEEKPFVICVGQKMVVEGLDDSLEGKEIAKKYQIELPPKKAFGEREREKVRLIPLNIFTEKNIMPKQGMVLHLDYQLVRIASVSGGRVLVDFNNPLAGKEVVYEFTIVKKINEDKEKIDSIIDYFLRKKLDYSLEGKKAIFEVDKSLEPLINMLNDKFKEIIGVEMIIKSKVKDKIKDENNPSQ